MKYDPREDWKLTSVKWMGLYGGEFQYTFESWEVREGSRCVRNIFADTEDEAWEILGQEGAPKW